mgnify:FL=1
MNRLHLFALVVAIIFVSSSVFTQTKNFKNAVKKLDKDHNGVISLVEFSSRSLKMFRWLDQDSDGIITKQEMDSKESLKKDRLLSKWADQLDRNDDKKIDKGEFILGANNKLKGKRNSRKKGPLGGTSEGKKEVNEAIFKAADGNKDGILDQKELNQVSIIGPKVVKDLIFRGLDSNGNNKITKEEYMAPVKKKFEKLDKNSDLLLDRQEFMASFKSKRKEAKDKNNMWKKRPPIMHKEGAKPR